MLPHRLVPHPWFCVVFFLGLAFPARFVAPASAEPPRWVSASSVHSPQYAPESAVDGDRQTRWASAQVPATVRRWLEVDFGREVAVDELVIHWERRRRRRTRSASRPTGRPGRPSTAAGRVGWHRADHRSGRTRTLSADLLPTAGLLGLVFHLGAGVSERRSARPWRNTGDARNN
jgi:hypothetical protein